MLVNNSWITFFLILANLVFLLFSMLEPWYFIHRESDSDIEFAYRFNRVIRTDKEDDITYIQYLDWDSKSAGGFGFTSSDMKSPFTLGFVFNLLAFLCMAFFVLFTMFSGLFEATQRLKKPIKIFLVIFTVIFAVLSTLLFSLKVNSAIKSGAKICDSKAYSGEWPCNTFMGSTSNHGDYNWGPDSGYYLCCLAGLVSIAICVFVLIVQRKEDLVVPISFKSLFKNWSAFRVGFLLSLALFIVYIVGGFFTSWYFIEIRSGSGDSETVVDYYYYFNHVQLHMHQYAGTDHERIAIKRFDWDSSSVYYNGFSKFKALFVWVFIINLFGCMASLFLLLTSMFVYFPRCAPWCRQRNSLIKALTGVSASLLLVLGVIVFPAKVKSAIANGYSHGKCPDGERPCNALIGSNDDNAPREWGLSVGWYLCVVMAAASLPLIYITIKYRQRLPRSATLQSIAGEEEENEADAEKSLISNETADGSSTYTQL